MIEVDIFFQYLPYNKEIVFCMLNCFNIDKTLNFLDIV